MPAKATVSPTALERRAVDVHSRGARTSSADNSAVVQAVNDELHAAGGGKILVPAGSWRFKVVLDKYVQLEGVGQATRILPPAAITAGEAIVRGREQAWTVGDNTELAAAQSADPHRVRVSNLMIDGQARNGVAAIDGIRFVSGNGDTFWGIAGYRESDDTWNDPRPQVDNVFVYDCGNRGAHMGVNMRNAEVDHLFAYGCRHEGIYNAATDCWWTNVSVGVCGDGFVNVAPNVHMTAVKSWWNVGTNVAGYFGYGTGIMQAASARTTMTGCETQDNYGQGLWLTGCQDIVAPDFTCGGEGGAGIYAISATGCDIRARLIPADRTLNTKFLEIANNAVSGCRFDLSDTAAAYQGGTLNPVVLSGSADATTVQANNLRGPAFERWTGATLQNSWAAFGGNYATPGYRKEGNAVALRGVVKGGSMATVAFTLPAHLRPPADRLLPVTTYDASQTKFFYGTLFYNAATGNVYAYSSGAITALGVPEAWAAGDGFSLDGVSIPI